MLFRVLELGRRSLSRAIASSSSFYVDYTISSSRLRQCGERHCRMPRRSFIAATTFAKSSSSSIFTVTDKNHNNKVTADPTAKRPTRKCDPFGLDGNSLSYEECNNTWMSTLEKGWTLIIIPPPPPRSDITIEGKGHEESQLYAAPATANPTFLRKHYYHKSFLDASQFITHVSSVATYNNHYPHLSFERILTSEVVSSSTSKEVQEEEMEAEKEEVMLQQHLTSDDKVMNEKCEEVEENTSSSSSPPQTDNKNNTANRRRRVMGWIVRSTVQCSTYRPPATSISISSDDNSSRGLTYHDFHLALCIDVEVKRNNSIQSLLLDST